MNNSIYIDGRELPYEFERKKVKNINLRVRSDGSVYVSANNSVSQKVIEEFLHKKAVFIFSAIDKYAEIAKFATVSHEYITGECFRYLGKDLRLVVEQGKNDVTSDGVYLTLTVTDVKDAMLKEKVIKKWYDKRCRVIFTEIITSIYPIFQKYGVAMPKLTLRDMTSRWGSCQAKRGIITLNKQLIETPIDTIEYVVMHEFVHFLHPNHSSKFYETLSTLMPDWKERKKHLESVAFCS